MANWKDFKIKL